MKNGEKSKEQLIAELAELQKRNEELEIAEIERMQEEEILRESEKKHRLLVESSTDMLFIVDLKGNFLFANQAFQRSLKYSKKEMKRINGFALVHPEDLDKVRQHFAQIATGKTVNNLEYRYKTKYGKYIHILNNAAPISDSEGNIVAALGMAKDISYRKKIEEELQKAHDELEQRVAVRTSELLRANEQLNKEITERRRMEEALRESEAKLKIILENIRDVIFQLSPQGFIQYVSPNAESFYGYKLEELIGRHFKKTTPMSEMPKAIKALNQVLSGEEVEHLEINQLDPKGNIIPTEINITPVKKDGKIIAVQGVMRDISERKKAEATLQESEEKYRDLIENLSEVIYSLDKNGKVLYVSPAVKSLLGYTPKEIENRAFGTMVHKDDLPRAAEAVQKILSGKSASHEYRIIAKSGKIHWILSSSRPVLKENRVIGIQGSLTDITERKEAETELMESEKKYRELIEKSLQGVFIFQDSRIVFANRALVKITGYTIQELLSFPPKKVTELVHPDDQELVWGRLKSRLEGKSQPNHYEFRAFRKDGTVMWMEIFVSLITFDGKSAIQVAIIDITERKDAEEALRESEEEYRAIFESFYDVYYRTDKDGVVTLVSPSVKTQADWNPEEVIGRPVTDFYLDADDHDAMMEELKKSGVVNDHEVKLLAKDGSVIEVSASTHLLFDKDGNPTGEEGVLRNITERKKAEEELHARKVYLDHLFESAQEAITMADTQGRVRRINQEFTRLFGYTEDEAVGQVLDELIVPADLKKTATSITLNVTKGERAAFEAIRRRKDGTLIDVSVLASPIIIDEEPVGTYGIYRDITEHKRVDEQIKASLKEKEILLQEVHHRVKNNMQIISSLLNLQSRHIKDEKSLELFKSSQNRVKSMALIHERLYQSKDFARIDVADYIRGLTNHLFTTYGISKDAVKLKINIKNIILSINTAIPCGLIINELVSNSLKHAFPNGKKGEIKISMRPLNANEIELTVCDNGVGVPEGMDFKNTKSLGLYLVNILAKDQLHGDIILDKKEGTGYHIRLRIKK